MSVATQLTKFYYHCLYYEPSDEEKEDGPVSDVSSVNIEFLSNISFGNSIENVMNEEPTKSDAKTQTSEFDYLFKETAKQEPFTVIPKTWLLWPRPWLTLAYPMAYLDNYSF